MGHGLLLALLLAAPNTAAAGSLIFHEPFEDLAAVQGRGAISGSNGWMGFVDGVSGKAADFSGSRHVCWPMPGRLDVNAGTVQFWVKTPTREGFGLFDIGNLGRPSSWGIFRNAGHYIMEVKNVANWFDQAWSANPVAADDTWHHISGVWQRDNTTTYFKVCVNGVCKNTFDGVTPDSRPNPSGNFCLGWSGWYGWSQSQFDELKIFDYAKSDDEIRRDFSPTQDVPVIRLNGARSVVVKLGEAYADPGATAADPSDGDLTARIAVAGQIDTAATGTYRLSYNVSNSAGREAIEKVRLVHVVDLSGDPVRRAFEYLQQTMDRSHRSFDVYTDFGAGGDHATPSGWMAAGTEQLNLLEIDPNWRSNCYGGFTCFRATVRARSPQPWVGMRWLEPDKNWSADVPNAGFDLRGATQVSFHARGDKGGERVEFVVGGTTGAYPDSIQPTISSGVITLTKDWQRYTIDLRGHDLSHVISPFGWVATSGLTFYLDDVTYDLARPDGLRFLRSYEVVDPDQETSLTNTAFGYDNALALLAFVARGEADDLRRAGILADTFVAALNKDRSFSDGRLRNAYMSGDLIHPAPGTARLPGWWDSQRQLWVELPFDVGTHTGNVAWPMLALLTYHEKTGHARYLDAVKQMAEWVEAHTRDSRGGYTGGYEGWETEPDHPAGQTRLTYRAAEHSIDLYPVFQRLHALTGESQWADRARHAKQLIDAMWNEAGGHVWVGTTADGVTINTSNIALDTQAWAHLALPDDSRFRRAVAWAETSCRVDADGFSGFDFNHLDRDGVWFEGTAQMALALKSTGQFDKAAFFLAQLRKAQTEAANADGKGLVAASRDHLTTGFSWEYFPRLHVGATAWFLLAELGYNPYSTTTIQAPVPPGGPAAGEPAPPNEPVANEPAANETEPVSDTGGSAFDVLSTAVLLAAAALLLRRRTRAWPRRTSTRRA